MLSIQSLCTEELNWRNQGKARQTPGKLATRRNPTK